MDGDAIDDLVVHFETASAGLARDSTQACITGRTDDLRPFIGCDVITVVPVGRDRPGGR